jgi:hypothetical protein
MAKRPTVWASIRDPQLGCSGRSGLQVSLPKIRSKGQVVQNWVFCRAMVEWLKQLAYALSLRLKTRARLEAENLMLRQQLNVLIRKVPKRLRLTNSDRLLLVWLYRLFPSILSDGRFHSAAPAIRVSEPTLLDRNGQSACEAPGTEALRVHELTSLLLEMAAASYAFERSPHSISAGIGGSDESTLTLGSRRRRLRRLRRKTRLMK